jgi:hypothetical protein
METGDIIFQDNTLYAKNKLNMVNRCLRAIGEGEFPLDTIVEQLPLGTDGYIAATCVRETMVEVQSRGWYFNQDYNFVLEPDVEGFITMPPNTLRADFGIQEGNRYTLRHNRVYDYLEQTYYIGKSLEADVIWLADYTVLPPEAYEYISYRAARKFQEQVIGSLEIDSFTVRNEADAYANLVRRELQTQDFNLQNSRVSTRIHNGYLIQGLYGNKGRRQY